MLASLLLNQHVREQGWQQILFVSRDCWLWHQLYQRLFPEQRSQYFFTSRKCLFRPTPSYLQYFRSVWDPRAVIVDVSSTGTSWTKFFSRIHSHAHCFFLVHIDNFLYLPESLHGNGQLKITSLVQSSELSVPFSKGLEMLNYAPHPVVEDVLYLREGMHLPVLAETLEYEAALPEAAHQSFRTCLERLSHYPHAFTGQQSNHGEVIRSLLLQISTDQRLGAVYAGHQAADTAYMQRVLNDEDLILRGSGRAN